MGAVFGDLERLRLGYIEDLPTGGRALPVGVRELSATAGTGGRVVAITQKRAYSLKGLSR